MKGIIFNLLEGVVSREHSDDVWDDLLDDAGVFGAYTSLGSYPDAELYAIVGAASARLGADADDIVRWFAREALPLLAVEYPEFFAPHSGTRPFLLTLNDVIHPEVRKLYPGADVPVFDFEAEPGGALRMGYASPRRLCSLAEGFIEAAAAHYGETVTIGHPECMKRGAAKCTLVVSLSS